jgi:AmmeMemoRadiSam system protein A
MKITELAKKSIEWFLKNQNYLSGDFILDEKLPDSAGVFVTLHNKKDGSLRGCIGTIKANKNNIIEEVIHNAVSAAFYDPRFSPLQSKELNTIEISVDVLQGPEAISSPQELDPQKYGVIVYTDDGRSGLLLPNIEGIDRVDEQITIACKKGDISLSENFKLKRFQVSRFYEIEK